jgi:hypothetical protein
MIDTKLILASLRDANLYNGGDIASKEAISAMTTALDKVPSLRERRINPREWGNQRKLIAYQQHMMRMAGIDAGVIDGLKGPQTLYGLERWQDRLREIPGGDVPAGSASTKWPRQSEVPNFYGRVGESQVRLIPPYPFYLYDTRQRVTTISVHSKVKDAAERVFQKVLDAYGQKQIHDLHLDRFFGSLAVRKMRGGSQWSMHSWGIAFDFDANRNQLRWGKDKAVFAKPIYDKWWDAWESEGAVSLGRERNYDYMHTQFARL